MCCPARSLLPWRIPAGEPSSPSPRSDVGCCSRTCPSSSGTLPVNLIDFGSRAGGTFNELRGAANNIGRLDGVDLGAAVGPRALEAALLGVSNAASGLTIEHRGRPRTATSIDVHQHPLLHAAAGRPFARSRVETADDPCVATVARIDTSVDCARLKVRCCGPAARKWRQDGNRMDASQRGSAQIPASEHWGHRSGNSLPYGL